MESPSVTNIAAQAVDLTSFNPPAIHNSQDVLSNNILIFGYSGSGVSSTINTLATAIQPTRTTSLVRALSRTSTPGYPSKTRMTINYLKHPLNYYSTQLRVNLWESWGISSSTSSSAASTDGGNNYDGIELDVILQGMLMEKQLMPRDAKAVSALLQQAKKPNNLSAIHAVAFCIPQDVLMNLQTDDLARIKNVLKQIRERGREPVLIITRLDQVGASIQDCLDETKQVAEAKELAAGIFGFDLSMVTALINYNSKTYEKASKRVQEVDQQAAKIMKMLLQQCQHFQTHDPSTLAFIKGKSAAAVVQKTSSLASVNPENAAQKIAEQHKQVEDAKKAKEIEESLGGTSGINFGFMQSQIAEEVPNSQSQSQQQQQQQQSTSKANDQKPVGNSNMLPSATPSSASTAYSAVSSQPSSTPALQLTESSPSPAESTKSQPSQQSKASQQQPQQQPQQQSSPQQQQAQENNKLKQSNQQQQQHQQQQHQQEVVRVIETTTVVKVDEATQQKVKALENQNNQLAQDVKELKALSKAIQSIQADLDKLSMSNSLSQQEVLSVQNDLKSLSLKQQEQARALSQQQTHNGQQQQQQKQDNVESNENKEQMEAIERHESQLAELLEKYDAKDSQLNQLNSKFTQSMEDLKKALDLRISSLEQQSHQYQLQQQQQQKGGSKGGQDIDEAIDPLKQDILRLNTKINEILSSNAASSASKESDAAPKTPTQPQQQQQVKDYKKEVLELQKNVDITSAKLESLNSQVSQQIDALQKELASLKSSTTAHPLDGKSNNNNDSNQNNKNDDVMSEVQLLKKQLEKTNERVANAEMEAKKATDAAAKAEKAAANGCKCEIM